MSVALQRPYVGLRPFERAERDIFKGRERDARFLCSKVFSARLTLLYAPSGVGKSSLLRTLVIPSLEEQHARAIYFDAWAGEDPTGALKSVLTGRASELGIPDPGAGAPSLRELVSLIASVDGQTVVLILDQFEEFLINHAQELDPLRKELAELVRHATLDVRMVLSLRQEFLAALEPFRNEILNLFQSTYLLDSLDDQGVRDAIQEPARQFGAEYEDGLVETLIRDLRAEQAVDLPMLQLVCGHLWDAAQQRGQSTITRALYEELGGASRIIDTFVRGVMPQRWQDQRLTAKLMRHLAPASGFKKPYSAGELADNENLDKRRVSAELNRLSSRGVLRRRTFRGQELFELQHDAFIRIIAPWRVEILRRAAKARQLLWLLTGVGIAGLFGVAIYVGHYRSDQEELRRNTEGILSELRTKEFLKKPYQERKTLAESRLDYAAEYLLLRATGPKRLDTLRELLKKYEDLQPPGYGIESFTTESGSAESEPFSPIHLQYSSLLDLDENYLGRAWRSSARSLAEQWGIPAPERLWLMEEALPMHLLRVTGPKLSLPIDVTIPGNIHEKDGIITSAQLPAAAQEFLNRFQDWTRVKELDDGRQWWVVPRWSLPVWKASGQLAIGASGLPALILASELRKKPEALLTPEVVDLLLKRVERRHPGVVTEARAARGDRLPLDLLEIVKLGHPLTNLEATLDGLAAYPSASSDRAAALVKESLENPRTPLPSLNGPWKSDRKIAGTAPSKTTKKGEIDPLYQWTMQHLSSADYYTIRLFAGRVLQTRFGAGGGFSPQFTERREALAYEFCRKFGFEIPDISYNSGPLDNSLAGGDDAFRVELLNQTSRDPQAQPIVTTADAALDRLMAALRSRAEAVRHFLLSQEEVNGLGADVDYSLKQWITQKYSMTDIKVLMRAVVSPSGEEPAQRRMAKGEESVAVPPENTLRHLDWLLRSLVFWCGTDDIHSVEQMTKALRRTQRARLKLVTAEPKNQAVSAQVAQGIAQLEAGSLPEAEKTFSGAIQVDREAANRFFLAAYPRSLRTMDLRRFTEACKDPLKSRLSLTNQIDLEDFLGEHGRDIEQDQTRRLGLCLLASYPPSLRQRRLAIETDLMKRHGTAGDWPPPEAGWLALKALDDYDPFSDRSEARQSAEAFLKSAIARLDSEKSWKMFLEAENLLKKTGPKAWCWDLLKELAGTRQDVRIPVELAVRLSGRERQEDLQHALELVVQLEKRIPAMSPNDRTWARDWTLYSKSNALLNLSRLGAGDHRAESEEIARELRNSSVEEVRASSRFDLIEPKILEEHYLEAHTMAREALAGPKGKENSGFYIEDFWADLFLGDYSGAKAVAQEALLQAGAEAAGSDTQESLLFVAALGKTLTRDAGFEEAALQFLKTNHPYVPYIAMLLYARMAGQAHEEALQVIKQIWAAADRLHWRDRLRGGDETAWRDALIGYYLGEVKPGDLFAKLETERAYAESDFRFLPFSRQALLCEAYFYDALLAETKGDMKGRDARLRQVLNTKVSSYYEFRMAKFLLQQSDRSR